ncbi:MAG: hypothetical protein ACPL7B_08240, partial [Candidatus Poribacteria bacterium]
MNTKQFLFISSVLIALTALIFAGCGSSEDEEILNGDGNITAGFASLKAGSWEELVSPNGTRDRNEFLGTDTYKGAECYLLEFETISSGAKVIN